MKIVNLKTAGVVALGILACLQKGANASPIPSEKSALEPMNGNFPTRKIETGGMHLSKRTDPLTNLENCIRDNGIGQLGSCAQSFLNDEIPTLVGSLENNIEAKIKKDMQDALQEGGNLIQSKIQAGVNGIAALLAAHLAVLIGKDVLGSKPARNKFGQLKNYLCGVSRDSSSSDDLDTMEKGTGQDTTEKTPVESAANAPMVSRNTTATTAVATPPSSLNNDPRTSAQVNGRYPSAPRSPSAASVVLAM
jgi:hypothetical protein